MATINSLTTSLGLSKKKVLLLGAGFVCKPTAQVLSDADIDVAVACRTLASAEKLCEGIKNAHAITVDVSNEAELDDAISKVELVVSLIPYTFHAAVIKSAIKNHCNVVTTSYVSPAMLELEQQCKDAGITCMNEIGLDPGIDHLYAVKLIDEVHSRGGKILSFKSYCGGLPAPEASDNPLGYKFSWSSRGVLLALRNAAKYWEDGKVVDISGPELMATAKPYHIYPGYNFVAYPNRDSTPYKERYNIPEAESIIRGTLRYGGFPEMVKTLVDIGYLSDEPLDILSASNSKPPTWAEATAKVLGSTSPSENDIISTISSKATFKDNSEKDRILTGLKWIGLLSDEPVTPRGNPLDTLCATLERKMQFEEGERDFVMLQHKFIIEEGGQKSTVTSTLCEYGEPTGPGSTSAMAKLVGVPCGVACLQVLDGTISEKGILAPLKTSLTTPLIEELKKHGIEMVEKTLA